MADYGRKNFTFGVDAPTPIAGSAYTVDLEITVDTLNYDAFTEAGSPSAAESVRVTVNPGVKVGSSSPANAGFDTGGPWNAATTFLLVNNGGIYGKGGNGGPGGGGLCPATPTHPGTPGTAGGDAVNLQLDTDIDNTNGYIRGGGGGGGGGGAYRYCGPKTTSVYGGGGGGGGAGYSVGSGGSGGAPDPPGIAGSPGSGGGNTTPGGGGAGGGPPIFRGGPGGAGGDNGAAGVAGNPPPAPAPLSSPGGSGGAAGKAVELNGNTVNWLGGGPPSPRVEGAVS